MFILCIKPFLIPPTISIHEPAWSDIGINSNNNRHYSNSMLITLAAISACWMHASESVCWLLINFHSIRIVLFKSTAQTVSGLFEQLHVCHHFIVHFAVTITNHKKIQSKSLLQGCTGYQATGYPVPDSRYPVSGCQKSGTVRLPKVLENKCKQT
jgi:hypothetical protein